MERRPYAQKTTLIIATYNWPEALECCLNSIKDQTFRPNEVIVADDGSSDETKVLIERWSTRNKVPIIHLWHTDEGFRLSEIRNKAILRATQPYIIQIDGDIIMDRHFIEDHVRSAIPGNFLCGSRVTLSKEVSAQLLRQEVKRPRLDQIPPGFLFNSVRFSLLSRIFAKYFRVNEIDKLRGCNMSFWKEDLLKINGYNEDMKGWGPEDKELAVRLINSGTVKRSLKFLALAYHLYHPETSRSNAAYNRTLLNKAMQENKQWTTNGISKHV